MNNVEKFERLVGLGTTTAFVGVCLYVAVQFTHAAVGNPFARRRREKAAFEMAKAINNLEIFETEKEEES